ncbi:MAG TPA: ABC transporter permease [Pyrinomonadaceae bacterium]|nr:ABC transporter permease [Pyrinomonadaceae bacterium]
MRKFLAVVRHEYRKIVLKWTFLIGTLLFPLLGLGFAVVPALIFSLKGEPTRLVVVDPTGRIAPRLKTNLSQEKIEERAREAAKDQVKDLGATQDKRMRDGAKQMAEGFVFVAYDAKGKPADQIRLELNRMAANDEIDAYLIVPENIQDSDARYEFLSRKAGDFVVGQMLKDALNEAVRSQRLAEANISETQLRQLSRNVDLDSKSINDKGEEKDSDSLFIASLVIGMMIYITLTIYGQVIMGAVVEEKETRIAEILFSSATPMQLMFGKLVGVGLAGLTQLGIWVLSLTAIIGFLSVQAGTADLLGGLPHVTPLMIVYFLVFFLVGYFIYASIFALIGASVTTTQEGGQFAFPAIMLLLIGFYFCFIVIRDPNSDMSFWVSVAPFFAPITMPVRILAETPPFWQIALAIVLNLITIVGLVWLASRVYRVGMLMYGKRATIPEILKWIRQA